MEEFIFRLEELLKNLDRDIEIATSNLNYVNDIRIRDMRDRWVAFRKILINIQDKNDISPLIEFAQKTFDAIDWNNSEQNARDINTDSQKILLDILGLLPMVERSLIAPRNKQERYQFILKSINARIRNILMEQE